MRIGGIEIRKPQLKRFMHPDGGLHVYCDAIEGLHDEIKLKKLLTLKGTTQQVTWKDEDGAVQNGTMTLLGTQATIRNTPDGKKITEYIYTLVWV